MRCHWGIPLSSLVFPPLSRAVHLISPSVSHPPPTLLPPLLTLLSHFLCKLSPLCDPGHLALLFYLYLLLALSLVVYLSPPPAPLPPSLMVTAGMQLFNEHSSASSPCSSAHHFPSASPRCISVYRRAAWCGITTARSPAWYTKICIPSVMGNCFFSTNVLCNIVNMFLLKQTVLSGQIRCTFWANNA